MVPPVLFVVFNRPTHTRRVLDAIRCARPERLYIASDGPRPANPSDAAQTEEVRKVVSEVDWPCSVKTLFRPENLGCRRAVSSAIDWFFTQETEGIILEDDILPDPSFFAFCAEMLARYRESRNVMHVAGLNVCDTWQHERGAYHFCRFGCIWGWATWRRAWRYYDVDIKAWANPATRTHILTKFFPSVQRAARERLYDDLAAGRIDTWDYQWTFARLLHSGLCVIPAVNLIHNIGFDETATHTNEAPRWAPAAVHSLPPPYPHQPLVADQSYDLIHLFLSANNLSYAEFLRLRSVSTAPPSPA